MREGEEGAGEKWEGERVERWGSPRKPPSLCLSGWRLFDIFTGFQLC